MDNNQMQQQVDAALAKDRQLPRSSQLAAAYVKAWAEVGVGVEKDANNPHFGNDYATLEAVEAKIKPILAKHDLAFLQTPGLIDGDKLEIVGLLIHTSGEQIIFKTHIALGAKITAQSVGSAITYGRRYQLMAVFGLAPVDDDGEAASAAPAAPKAKKAKKDPALKSDASYAEVKQALLKEIEEYEGTADDFSAAIKPRVAELEDADINAAYVAKRRTLRK